MAYFRAFLALLSCRLALGELRCTTCSLQTVLLTLLHTRIAGQEASLLQGSGRPEGLRRPAGCTGVAVHGGPQRLLFPLPPDKAHCPAGRCRNRPRRHSGHCPAAGRSGCGIHCTSVPAHTGRALQRGVQPPGIRRAAL